MNDAAKYISLAGGKIINLEFMRRRRELTEADVFPEVGKKLGYKSEKRWWSVQRLNL